MNRGEAMQHQLQRQAVDHILFGNKEYFKTDAVRAFMEGLDVHIVRDSFFAVSFHAVQNRTNFDGAHITRYPGNKKRHRSQVSFVAFTPTTSQTLKSSSAASNSKTHQMSNAISSNIFSRLDLFSSSGVRAPWDGLVLRGSSLQSIRRPMNS